MSNYKPLGNYIRDVNVRNTQLKVDTLLGVSIFKMGEEQDNTKDIFDEAYIDKINKIKLPNTKIKILQKLLAKATHNQFKKDDLDVRAELMKKICEKIWDLNEA